VQTLKTAAIVVLVMTVMYGAYVSLTTPPEPLPAEVQSMLEFTGEESLAIDAGLPESLETLEINREAPSAVTAPSSDTFRSPGSDIASTTLDGGVNPSLPGPELMVATPPTGISTTLSDLPAMAPQASAPVPAPATPQPSAQSLATTTAPSYPSTNRTFELPDPNTVISSFDGAADDQGAPANSHLALASGTSDSQSVDNPPSAASLQAADVPTTGITPNLGLANAIRNADKQFLEDKRRDALATLSIFYNTPNLSGEQRSELVSRLDPLAREVIYSKRHLLEQPHRVGQNETLMEIAARYEVPWQLLANINQISDPVTILPGTELKVVRGPFRAEVNLTSNELTLFLGDLYAGRFPIAIGNDPAPNPGTYTVQDKQTSKTFYNHAGSPVLPGSADNPYGNVWIDLGGQVCIHGSPNTSIATDKGCISLAADYADDLYGILSQGSSITIRR
jgi:lipoprotein-anchoring transpeptidase ErfK/SrfK